MKRYIALLLAALMLILCGCSSLLHQEYSRVEPHANRYWEDSGSDIMRAESYQDLVTILMLLVEGHEESGVLRLYLTDVDYRGALNLMKRAVTEVREETAIGAYVLTALNYEVAELRNSYYQVELHPAYRRTAEDVAAIRETASSSAIYDLIIDTWEMRAGELTVRYSYLAEEPAELLKNIRQLQLELEGVARADDPPAEESPTEEAEKVPPAEGEQEAAEETGEDLSAFPAGHTPWTVTFYPPESNSGIVEIFLTYPAPEHMHMLPEETVPAVPVDDQAAVS